MGKNNGCGYYWEVSRLFDTIRNQLGIKMLIFTQILTSFNDLHSTKNIECNTLIQLESLEVNVDNNTAKTPPLNINNRNGTTEKMPGPLKIDDHVNDEKLMIAAHIFVCIRGTQRKSGWEKEWEIETKGLERICYA